MYLNWTYVKIRKGFSNCRILLNEGTTINIVLSAYFHLGCSLTFCYQFLLSQIEKVLHLLFHKHLISCMIALIIAECIVSV
jgi:hypothetical protein